MSARHFCLFICRALCHDELFFADLEVVCGRTCVRVAPSARDDDAHANPLSLPHHDNNKKRIGRISNKHYEIMTTPKQASAVVQQDIQNVEHLGDWDHGMEPNVSDAARRRENPIEGPSREHMRTSRQESSSNCRQGDA